MKTKFTQILMLLAITVGMGVIVTSCKDTNEDENNKLRTEIQESNSLIAALKTQVTNLQDQINALKTRLDQIKECECDLSDLQRTIAGLQADIANLKANKADKSEIDRLQSIVNNLTDKYNYIEGLLIDNYVTKKIFESEIARLEKLIANAGGSETDISSILKRLAEVENGLIEAKALAQTANTMAESAKNTAEAAKAAATLAQTAAMAAQSDAASAKNLATAVQKIANSNTERISTIEGRLITMNVDLQTALTNANIANQRSKQDSIRINELEKSLAALAKTLDKTQAEQDAKIAKQAEDIKALQNDLKALRSETESKLAELKSYAETQVAALNTELGKLKEGLDATNTTVGELSTALDGVKGDISELQSKVDELEALKTKVDEMSQKIDELDGKLAALSEVIAQQVSGVIVQGTYNPAFGTFGVPTNIQSNILVAYYGEALNKVTFPVLNGSTLNYLDANEVLTEDEVKNLGDASKTTFTAAAGETLVNSAKNNAGTLYLTINPAERDFNGLKLSLENSQGKESRVMLGAAKKSTKMLRFGWTRATEAGENGFYEVPAYVEDFEHVQKINVNKDELKQFKNDIQEIVENQTKTNFVEFAKDIYDVIGHLNMDANAVKVAWTTADGEQHSIRSTYNIAAFGIQPLNFGSYKDLNFTNNNIPGYNKVMNLINRIGNKAKTTVDKVFNKVEGNPVFEDVDNIDIKSITLKSYDEATTTAQFTVSFAYKEKNHSVDIDFDFAEDIAEGRINNALDEINKVVDDVNAELANIDSYKASAYNEVDDYVAFAKSEVENYTNKFINFINNINARFQPVLLVGQGTTCIPSAAESVPTHVKAGKLGLIPTTWSFELAVPVCKKHIAIVNVTKSGVSYPSKAKKINADNEKLNTVLSGDERNIRIEGLEAGYTYTIAYSAMDFAGQISTKRYYVTAD